MLPKNKIGAIPLREYLLKQSGEWIKRGSMDWYYQLREPVSIWIDWRNAKTNSVERLQFAVNEVWPKCFFAGQQSRPFWSVIQWGTP